jgi:hypothetical protein
MCFDVSVVGNQEQQVWYRRHASDSATGRMAFSMVAACSYGLVPGLNMQQLT